MRPLEMLLSAIENGERIIINHSEDAVGTYITFRIKNESSATGFTDICIYDKDADQALFV